MVKKALVTGACGFTGTHMVELLCREGWDVTATDLTAEQHGQFYCESGNLFPAHYDNFIENLGVKYVAADLTDKESLRSLFTGERYDVVFHTASLYDYFALWDVLYRVNVTGAQNLAELAVEYKAGRFVHWSTDGVYGETKQLPGDENSPFNPPNNYSKSKAEQEKMLWAMHHDKGLPLTVVRPAPIYGPRHRYGVFHILYGMKKIGTGVVVSWYPKSKTLMMPSVHVTDLVRAALFVSDKDVALGQAYNVLSDCITQTDFLLFICRALGLEHVMRIPVWWPMYKLFAAVSLRIIQRLDRKARALGTRPKVDVPMVEYITHQYWFSNDKIKKLGFKFIYQDPCKGMWEYIGWCREMGWL